MKFLEIIASIRSALVNSAGAEMVFGKSTQIGDLHVIPVARVSFGLGGGGGSSPIRKKHAPKPDAEVNDTDAPTSEGISEGGGGGGQCVTSPVGIYTLKGDKVEFHPVIGIREVAGLAGFMTLILVKMILMINKRKK